MFIDSDEWPEPVDLLPNDYQRQAHRRSRLPVKASNVASVKKTIVKISRPPSSAPANHEINGFMPARNEYDVEYENEAEVNVREMVFEVADTPEEKALKSSVLSIYNKVLDRRLWRKNFIRDRNLTDFKKIQTAEKKRAREHRGQRDMVNIYFPHICRW